MRKFCTAVTIGRFQPPHAGHFQLIRLALEKADRLVLCLGSSYSSRTVKNPWTFAERVEMLCSVLTEEEQARISFVPLRDRPYDHDLWYKTLGEEVVAAHDRIPGRCMAEAPFLLVGAEKDASSYYLKEIQRRYPTWDSLILEPAQMPDKKFYASSDIRRRLFDVRFRKHRPVAVPESVWKLAKQHLDKKVIEDWQLFAAEADDWKDAPYPPIFQTTDAVILGHDLRTAREYVLLVERGHAPGRGKYALPGGYVEAGETLLVGCLRELREETGLVVAVPRFILKGQQTFDAPARSLRGRVITTAFYFVTNDLPPVVAGDDAGVAFWFPLDTIQEIETRFFDDHLHIIQSMLKGF